MALPAISKTLRAAAVAIALGATAITAMPAQAASPSVNFSFSIGGGGHHWSHGAPRWRDWSRHNRFRHCMTDRQVRHLLNRHGYRNISFERHRGPVVEARARKGHARYVLVVDACRGRILDVRRVRR